MNKPIYQFKNYIATLLWNPYTSMDKLENDLTNALFEVSKSKETIQNLVGFHWAIF